MTKLAESKLKNIIIIYRLLPNKINSLLKVQNSFLIKDDLIQNSIVLYKKENLSLSREKKRNRSLLDNKAYFFNKYQQNKKYLNIRINTTSNNNNKNCLKLQNKPLTSSSSENKNLTKLKKKKRTNSSDKKHKLKKDKNNSVQLEPRSNNSIYTKENKLKFKNNNSNSTILLKINKNIKKENILKKRNYGEIKIESSFMDKDKGKEKDKDKINTSKNKNNKIITYNNQVNNGNNKRNKKYYSKICKYKIETSINNTLNLDKKKKVNSHSKNVNNDKTSYNVSNLTKRRSYIVPSIKTKKRKKEEKKSLNPKDDCFYTEEKKQLFMSHLIESKQIEYLKDYEKYKVDFKDKLIKKNEKKIRAINDENLIEKLISDDDEEEKNVEIQEDNGQCFNSNQNVNLNENRIKKDVNNEEINKKNNYIKNENKINDRSVQQNNFENNNYSNYYNSYRNNIEEKVEKIKENNMKDSLENQNNFSNDINIESDKLCPNILRKPKINTLEYIYRINNNIDVNKLMTSLSCLDVKSNETNLNENKEEINDNEPESKSSVNVLWTKKNKRPKEEINDFIKNNRQKIKHNEIKIKIKKNDETLKRFIRFIQLQKNIEENKKLRSKNSPSNRESNFEINIKKTLNEIHISQNTSLSSTLNQKDFYISCYDAQKIYSAKENDRLLLRNNSMVLDDKQKRNNQLNINNDYYNNHSKSNNYRANLSPNISNDVSIKKQNSPKKKVDDKLIKTIKNVINKLNNFMNDCINQNGDNTKGIIYKNKRYIINNYEHLLKNASKMLLKKNKKIIPKNKSNANRKIKMKLKDKEEQKSLYNIKQIPINDIKKPKNKSQNKEIFNKINLNNYNEININAAIIEENSKSKNKSFREEFSEKLTNKVYKFTEEQLNKYEEILNYLTMYLKLLIQKNSFNIIIYYTNIKNRYISGLNQIVFFIKKKPFNYLRIIQQREYYQVILRQFYLPYLTRAFNNIKSFVLSHQKFSEAENILRQIYFMNFLKRMLFYIQIKESEIENDFNNNLVIEEEKDEKSYESSAKEEFKNNLLYNEEGDDNASRNTNNNNDENVNNNIEAEGGVDSNMNKNVEESNDENNTKNGASENDNENENELYADDNGNNTNNLSQNTFNKENSESYDEIKIITNTFNIIMNNISRSPKIYVFDLFKKYYFDSKNLAQKNETKNNDTNLDYNEKQITNKNDNYQFPYNNNSNESIENNANDNKLGVNYINNDIGKNEESEEKEVVYYEKKEKHKIPELNEKYGKNQKLFIPYKGEIKKNLMNNNNSIPANSNNDSKNENSNSASLPENILKDEFKRYEQPKKFNNNQEENSKENNIDNEVKDMNNDKNKNSENDDLDLSNNTYSLNNTNNQIKKSDFIENKNDHDNRNENNSISASESENANFNFKLNNNLKNHINTDDNYKRYSESEDLTNNDKEEVNKIIANLPNELEQKIIEDLTNEILNELFKEEVDEKDNLLSYKKDIKHPSNNSMLGLVSKESISAISHSPGRKYNKSNNSQSLVNNNESYHTVPNNSIQDEDALNSSFFKRTIYQIKMDIELNYYENNILPKLLNLIKENIDKNYLSIIDNLKKPLKKNEKEIMEELSSLITCETIYNNNIIKYDSKFSNKEIDKNEYIEKKLIDDFNEKLKNESIFYEKYYYQYLNKCVYDAANEIIKKKRLYGNIGEPLLWSMRNRIIEYKYKDTKLFKDLFISDVMNELKQIFFSKIGAIIENIENLNISQFSKERDIKFNENIRDELKKENDFDKLDEQETAVKLMIEKIIMNQLLNEVIEILEHIQYSRKEPEKYNYNSIFSCNNIPLLSFQNINNSNENECEEEEEKSEDRTNQ